MRNKKSKKYIEGGEEEKKDQRGKTELLKMVYSDKKET